MTNGVPAPAEPTFKRVYRGRKEQETEVINVEIEPRGDEQLDQDSAILKNRGALGR